MDYKKYPSVKGKVSLLFGHINRHPGTSFIYSEHTRPVLKKENKWGKQLMKKEISNE